MNNTELATVGRRYHALRGLLAVPTGVLFIAAGLTNSPPIGDEQPNNGLWVFLAVVVAAGIAYVMINRYYEERFGRVEPSMNTKAHLVGYTILGAVAICAGITIDSQFDLPIGAYGFAFAVSLLAYYLSTVGAQPYHRVLLGGLALVTMMPVWGDVDDKVSLTMLPMGAVTIAIGLLDHQTLVRSLNQLRASGPANDFGVDGR